MLMSEMLLFTLLALPVPQADSIALEGGTVHTLVPGEEARVATVLVTDGSVVAVGTELELPPGTERVDVSGMHVTPSLIDGYVNFDRDHDVLYTITGVGLVCDQGGNYTQLVLERDPERRARRLGPDLITAGALLDGDPPASRLAAILRDPAAVEASMQILLDVKVDFFSMMLGLTGDVRRKVIEVAHANELEVWGPRASDLDLAAAVAEGQDGFHRLDALLPPGVGWDAVQAPAFLAGTAALAEAGRPLVPLFYASARHLEDQSKRPDTASLFSLLTPVYTSWWQAELDQRSAQMNQETLEGGKRILKKQSELVKALFDAGVHLVPGTGTPQPWIFPGRSIHQELELWEEAGIPAAEVLALATRRAAEAFGVEERYGTISPGTVGSLLVLREDPTEKVAALRAIDRMLVRGDLIGPEEVADLLATITGQVQEQRDRINTDVEVAAPPLPQDAVVVLDGVVDILSYGLRVSREHFQVARTTDGRTVFAGRTAYSDATGGSGGARTEMLISQTVRDGLLERVEVSVQNAEQTLRYEGEWTAESWRMRRTLNEQHIAVDGLKDRPALVDAGSVTTLLLLGQLPPSDRFSVVHLQEGLEAEPAMWAMAMDDKGNHLVRTHVGQDLFRLDEVGAPERGLFLVGPRNLELALLERNAFGGPGLPLPKDKLDRVLAAEAAAETEEASGGEGGEEPAPEAGPGETEESGEEDAGGSDAADEDGAGDGR